MSRAELTTAQRHALAWLLGEDVPPWYDSAPLGTLRALERRGLVGWTTDGHRPYWTRPTNGRVLDHWYPYATPAGEAAYADTN